MTSSYENSAHTLGPWFAVAHGKGSLAWRVTRDVKSPRGDVANVLAGLGAGGNREVEANARLIAAAPELLAALEYAAEQAPLNDPEEDDSDLLTIEVTHGWVREVRQALAKARGE